MIESMTGFGKAEGQFATKKISIQLKSLNSKQTDISIKAPSAFKEKELNYRKLLTSRLKRGKVEMYLLYEISDAASSYQINEAVFKNYFNQLKDIEHAFKLPETDLFSAILRMPDILKSNETEFEEEDWKTVEEVLNEAIENLIEFRKAEGEILAKDLENHIGIIIQLLNEVVQYEEQRTETVRNRLEINLEAINQKEKINPDRLEQEMIFYLEKYDISEEKVRLKAHCDYFRETMKEDSGQGKKLGFISQEIGREINTLGSKANHVEMQKLVVQMKDYLEKIKEQVLNVL